MRRLAVVLVAAHLVVLGFGARRFGLPDAALAALVAFVVVKHLGLLAPLGVWLRRRRGRAG